VEKPFYGAAFFIVGYKVNYQSITDHYYAHFLGNDKTVFGNSINLFFNAERDSIPKGYSRPMDIYILAKNETFNIAFGNNAKEIAAKLIKRINEPCTIEQIKTILENEMALKVRHSIKFIFKNPPGLDTKNNAIILGKEHRELYESFFKKNNPSLKDYSWIRNYFDEIAEKRYCHGVIVDGLLASATDAPDMSYMGNEAQEIGINTLEAYRGKGYAKAACLSMISELLAKNICPLWSAHAGNAASEKLAYSVGFEKYGDVLTASVV
jgi:hypothetical protein